MKRRTEKKRASRFWADELKRMRRLRDGHRNRWWWIEAVYALTRGTAE